MSKCQITGVYRSPDGTSHRYKAGAVMPEGYELVSRGEIADLPEVVAEANADQAGAKAITSAPENKAQKPPKVKD